MALGFLSSREKADSADNSDSYFNNSPDPTKDKHDYDVEGAGGARRSSLLPQDSSDASFDVGKQIELEAENSIKYRTCSWKKVGLVSAGVTSPMREMDAHVTIRLRLCSSRSISA
jgi:hypothetical protein